MPSKTRILLLLDASGSMNESWNGQQKYEVAKEVIYETIDSLQKAQPEVELALRVFGHQSAKYLHDCKDSKLEVPFAARNSANSNRKAD